MLANSGSSWQDLQVKDLEAEAPDQTVPFHVPFPDLDDEYVPTVHAIALTGDRVVTSFFRTWLPGGVQRTASTPAPPAPAEASSNALPSECQQADESIGAAVCAGAAGCAPQQHGPLAGARHLAAVMRLEAPTRLTLQEV